MTESICFMKKDTLVIKAPTKPAMTSRMVVLLFAMVCGVYICSMCMKQVGRNDNKNENDNVIMAKFDDNTIINKVDHQHSCPPHSLTNHYDDHLSEIEYIHYPKPQTFTRKECACNGVRYFAILSMQRSGSGWFETLLNSHTNVSSNGELFSVRERRVNVSAIFKTMDKLYNLDWLSSASKNHCSSAVGFKWMLNQGLLANHIEIVEYFKRRGVLVIFLFRRNLLRRMISVLANSFDKDAKLLNGTHKSHVHSPFEAQVLAKYKPKINTTLMMSELRESNDTCTRVLEYFNTTRHIVLYYEDVIYNRTKLEEVQEFLRLPQKELNSRQVKIHTAPLSQQVENWDDVREALIGTSFETYIDQN